VVRMIQNIEITKKNGEIIHTQYQAPNIEATKGKTPLIIMVNGFPKSESESYTLFSALAEKASLQNCASIRFDFIGNHSSALHTQDMTIASMADDLTLVIAWAHAQGHEKVGFVAEGLGAAVTMIALPDTARFCAFLWPAFDLQHICNHQFDVPSKEKDLIEHTFINHDGLLIGADMIKELQTFDLIPHLEKSHCPTLLLHGRNDTVISPENIEIARKHLMSPRLDISMFDDGEHKLDQPNHRKTCISTIMQFTNHYAMRD